MLNSTQRKLGYREVFYNVKTQDFVTNGLGDNYESLPLKAGDNRDDDGDAGIGIVGGIDEVLAENNVAAPNQTLRFDDPDLQPLVDAGIISADDINTDFQATSNHRAVYSRYGVLNTADEYTNQTFINAYGVASGKPQSSAEWGTSVDLSGEGLHFNTSPRGGTSDETAVPGLIAIRVAINFDDKFTVTHGGSCKATEFILTSPNGTEYALSVADDGTLSTTAV